MTWDVGHRVSQKSSGGSLAPASSKAINISISSRKWGFLSTTWINAASGPSLSIFLETSFLANLYSRLPGLRLPSSVSIVIILAMAWNLFIWVFSLLCFLWRNIQNTKKVVMSIIVAEPATILFLVHPRTSSKCNQFIMAGSSVTEWICHNPPFHDHSSEAPADQPLLGLSL